MAVATSNLAAALTPSKMSVCLRIRSAPSPAQPPTHYHLHHHPQNLHLILHPLRLHCLSSNAHAASPSHFAQPLSYSRPCRPCSKANAAVVRRHICASPSNNHSLSRLIYWLHPCHGLHYPATCPTCIPVPPTYHPSAQTRQARTAPFRLSKRRPHQQCSSPPPTARIRVPRPRRP